MNHLTDEQLNELIERDPTYEEIQTVKNMMKKWYDGREPDGLDQETIPIMVLMIVSSYEAERKAHQATRAELEAVREVVEAARVFRKTPYGYPHDNLLNKLNAYDRKTAYSWKKESND